MRLSWSLFWGVVLLLSPLITGCSSDDGDTLKVPEGPGVTGVDALISFEHLGTLTLAPGEDVEVSAVGKPSARYAMTFLLIGEFHDASLDRTEVVADEEGRGTVKLRAPNDATYFAVRVTVQDGPSATLNVAVSDQGFGSLSIVPEYEGNRETREWVTSVVTGTTCENLAAAFPEVPEGPTPVITEPGEAVLIDSVPVGPNLAVFVRAGHYMWGCADESDLVANETVDVGVQIADAPLNLGDAELDITLDLAPTGDAWTNLVDVQRTVLIDEFLAGDTPEQMLVSAMSYAFPGDQQEFATASSMWDLSAHFSTYEVNLPVTLANLVDEGLVAEPLEITGRVSGVANAPGHAVFTLQTFGSATAEIMAIPAEYAMSFTADPDDTVRLGGTLFWMPSRYFGHVAEQAGFAQYQNQNDFAEVLGEIAHCADLSLDGLAMCTGDCIVDLCKAGLAARWNIALGASAETFRWGELPFASSGTSRFDDVAVVTGFTGSWLGELVAAEDKADVNGAAVAEDADEQPPE